MKGWFAGAALAVSLVVSVPAGAGVLALTPAANGGFGNPGSLNLGWSFQVTVPIRVTGLAYFEDSDPAPLQDVHTVGIWVDGNPNTPLVTAGVGPGAAVIDIPLSNGVQHFYHVDVAPVVLTPGTTYVVSGTPVTTDTFYSSPFFGLGPEIAFVSGRYGTTPGGYADSITGAPQLGGNFLYDTAIATPEPATALLLGTPLAVIALRRRRKRK